MTDKIEHGDAVIWSTSPPGTFGQATMQLPAVVVKVKKRVQIRLESGELLWVSAEKLTRKP